MQTIDLEKIIRELGLTKEGKFIIAQQIFPENKYPVLALNRIISGEAVLDANQISKLSMLLGIPIDQLFGSWKTIKHKQTYIFTNGNYRAELDTITWQLLIFDNNSLFHEEVIFPPSITVKDLLSLLNKQIKNHEN